ncbi:hypothetical protein [Streptosporangium sp. NBC_01756]|uniref:hypothetical protein n=1 Tax=Streptosporangium sp. NBC_01756 TaxID=2975950 RepID=UPI002DDAF53B|nr:hypothetical protein [Streptosporangium sp. NBC_01756]WSC86483.1 transposase [Streptosporangium sp. NBC_01756]
MAGGEHRVHGLGRGCVVAIDMCNVFEAAVRDSLPHVSTWWSQILAAITTGVTNIASEGINRAIKTDAVHLYANALQVKYRRTLIGRCINDSYKTAMLQG